jgi:uncharacterized protein
MVAVDRMLRTHAKQHGVRLDIIEKDYALSYLLAGIGETPVLGNDIALKGGTALRKLYYPDHRFSEDLDYSTLTLKPEIDFASMMEMAVERMRARLFERGPFEVQVESLRLREPHPGDQVAYLLRVRFPNQRQPLCRLKVEISVDEPILLPVDRRQVLHGFEERLQVEVHSYALAEIVAEKLRALLQSRARLSERGWGASRVCRDYYDLWSVLSKGEHFGGSFTALVSEKCRVRGVSFEGPDDFMAPELLGAAREAWAGQLLPFVPHAPPADKILLELKSLIPSLLE